MLYFTLAAQKLISTDISLKNIYFRHIGGDVWVAGILDIDHIAHIKKPAPPGAKNATWDWIRLIRDKEAENIASAAIDGRPLTTSFDFMEKAFELTYGGNLHCPWIKFDEKLRTRVPVLIEPELIDEVRAEFRALWQARGLKK
jgi:hypothetical protein